MRDRARLPQEEVAFKIAERTGRHLHLSSVVTVMFLPSTRSGTIFGMNTKGLPSTKDDWGFGVARAVMRIRRAAFTAY